MHPRRAAVRRRVASMAVAPDSRAGRRRLMKGPSPLCLWCARVGVVPSLQPRRMLAKSRRPQKMVRPRRATSAPRDARADVDPPTRRRAGPKKGSPRRPPGRVVCRRARPPKHYDSGRCETKRRARVRTRGTTFGRAVRRRARASRRGRRMKAAKRSRAGRAPRHACNPLEHARLGSSSPRTADLGCRGVAKAAAKLFRLTNIGRNARFTSAAHAESPRNNSNRQRRRGQF